MYTCLIADDQIIERDILKHHLSKIKDIEIVAECNNGLEASAYLQNESVDIVISDIEMPGLDGLGLLRSLNKPPVFIFVSSYGDFAVESFNLDVVDYIVKPITYERIFKATNKAIEYLGLKAKLPEIGNEEALSNENTVFDEKYIFIKDIQGYTKIQINDILYFESMGDFSKIHTLNNKKYVVLVSLKNIEKQLSRFIFRRIHKQFIVSILHIETIGLNDILLQDQQTIPLSASYKQALMDTVVRKTLLKR